MINNVITSLPFGVHIVVMDTIIERCLHPNTLLQYEYQSNSINNHDCVCVHYFYVGIAS